MSEPGHSHVSGRPLLFAGFIVTGFVTTLLGPVLPWLTARWHLSDAAAGALFTIQFTGSIVVGAMSGLIVGRFGSARTLCAGYVLMAAGFAGLAVGDRILGTIAIAVAGIGLGCVVPTTNLLVARLAPERAASALGALNFCWGIGAATWPMIIARFTPVPGVRLALLLAAFLLLVVAARMVGARFPVHALRVPAGTPAALLSARRLAVFGFCIALYSGIESAFGGWITEYTRRLTIDAATMRWETIASAFWGGLAGGRGLVAIALARRFENATLFAGLLLVGACAGDAPRRLGVVAGVCRRRPVRARSLAVVPGDDGGLVARDAAERRAADGRARLAWRRDRAVARRRDFEPDRLALSRPERPARAPRRAHHAAGSEGDGESLKSKV